MANASNKPPENKHLCNGCRYVKTDPVESKELKFRWAQYCVCPAFDKPKPIDIKVTVCQAYKQAKMPDYKALGA